MDVATPAHQAQAKVRRSDGSDWMDHAVRVGLLSYGLVHLVLAWLAVRLAFGDGGGSASGKGALHELATTTAGRVTLYVVAAGFLALVVWQVLEAVWGHRREDGAKRLFKRLVSVGKAVVYGALGVTAFKTAIGSSSGGENTDGITARLMSLPAGPVIVGAVGLAILGVACGLVYSGLAENFRSDMETDGQIGKDGSAYVWFGKIGYVSKGVAIAVVGALFLYAAFTHDPDKSGGLDQALHEVLQQPFGAPILVVIALGLACFGLFCFAWARHLDR
jgi:hypothetical protein